MRRTAIALILLALAPGALAADTKTIGVTLTNKLAIARPNEPVVIRIADLKEVAPDFNPRAFRLDPIHTAAFTSIPGGLAAQADDTDGDGTLDEIAFALNFAPQSARDMQITYAPRSLPTELKLRDPVWLNRFPRRAHAAFQQKYEGMGWESDRVAWRMYFDERNAFDMYGKRKHGLALDYFAKPEVDYHSESPIGRDVFKVGDALGIGAVGAYANGKVVKVSTVEKRSWKVVADGPVRAIADLVYTGWDVEGRKAELKSRITVWAGQHWFEHAVTALPPTGLTLVTGLPKKPDVVFVEGKAGAPFIATWGHQALVPGATATEADPQQNLGLGIVMVEPFPMGSPAWKDPANHLARVRGTTARGALVAKWRVVSAWDQEQPDGDTVAGLDPALMLPGALRSAEAWKAFVAGQARLAASPIEVRILTADGKETAR